MRRPALVAGRNRCRHSERTRRAAPSRHRMEGRQTPQRCRQGGAYSSPHRERSRIRRRCRKPKRSTIKHDTSNLHVCRSHSEYKIGKSGRSRCFPKNKNAGSAGRYQSVPSIRAIGALMGEAYCFAFVRSDVRISDRRRRFSSRRDLLRNRRIRIPRSVVHRKAGRF